VSHVNFPSSISFARSSVVRAFVLDAMMKRGVGVYLGRFPELAYPEAPFECRLAIRDEADGNPRNLERLPRLLHKVGNLLDAAGIERVRRLAREGFLHVSLRCERLRHEGDRPDALLLGGLTPAIEQHHPARVLAEGARAHVKLFIRGGLVVVIPPLIPAVARVLRLGDMKRTLEARLQHRPRPGDGVFR
jgi:hypothetical protein